MKIGIMWIAALALFAAPSYAQMGDHAQMADRSMAIRNGLRGTYDSVKDWITKSADQVSEDLYSFKPTPEVRSLGELFGHVANANFMICSGAAGEKSPNTADFEKVTAKAEIVKGLRASFAYCDQAFDGMTEAKAHETITFFGQQQPRLSVLAFNTSHDYEHYGNIVTYMRLKGMVPPSSQRGM